MKWYEHITCLFEDPSKEWKRLIGLEKQLLEIDIQMLNIRDMGDRIHNAQYWTFIEDNLKSVKSKKERESKMELKQVKEVIIAFEQGKEIEWRYDGARWNHLGGYTKASQILIDINEKNCEFRIKPEPPKPQPFDFSSMPFPCVIRRNNNIQIEGLVVFKAGDGVSAGRQIAFITYKELMDEYEWRSTSIVKRITSQCIEMELWKPCTKESLT